MSWDVGSGLDVAGVVSGLLISFGVGYQLLQGTLLCPVGSDSFFAPPKSVRSDPLTAQVQAIAYRDESA